MTLPSFSCISPDVQSCSSPSLRLPKNYIRFSDWQSGPIDTWYYFELYTKPIANGVMNSEYPHMYPGIYPWLGNHPSAPALNCLKIKCISQICGPGPLRHLTLVQIVLQVYRLWYDG